MSIDVRDQGVGFRSRPVGSASQRQRVRDPATENLPASATVRAPANARDEVKRAAHYITKAAGGRGAVREICELLLEAHGHWADILNKYEVDPKT